MLLLTLFLAFFGADSAHLNTAPEQPRITGTLIAGRSGSSAERLIFNAKSSTAFLDQLASFVSSAAVDDPYAQLVKTVDDTAAKEGVASTPSGNLADLAYDWIDQNEWKYFVRLEVDLPAFEELFEAAKEDPLYRDVALASLIYGGQGILDFKRNVREYIDDVQQQHDFQSIKFKPQDKKDAQWAFRLMARQVDAQFSRYRPALAYLHSRAIDENALQQRAQKEQNPRLKAILLHYAELMHAESQHISGSGDLRLRIAIVLSDVERDSPETVFAVLRVGEKNKQVVFDKEMKSFDADCGAFRFLLNELSE